MTEDHPLNPRSPYAGTKAGGDRLAYSYWCTYELPVTVIRPFNNYGPFQHPEKVIPRFIIQALCDRPLTIHGDGHASRDWLHVFDTAEAITARLRGAARPDRGRDDQRRDRRRRVGRADRRHDPRDAGQAAVLKLHVDDRPGPGRPSHRLHRQGGAAARLAVEASPSPTGWSARSAGTATTPNGGRPSWPRSRRRRPSDAPPHTRPRGRARAAACDRCRRARSGVRTIVCDADPRRRRRARLERGRRGRPPRRPRRRRPDRAGHRLAGTDRGRRRRGPGHAAPDRRGRGGACTDKIAQRNGSTRPACPSRVVDRGAARISVRRQGRRPTGPAGDDDRRATEDLEQATERARARRAAAGRCYEEFVPGPGGDGQRLLDRRPLPPVTVTDRDHFEGVARRRPPPRLPRGRDDEAAIGVAEAAVAALGIREGPSYVQLILSDSGPVSSRSRPGSVADTTRRSAGSPRASTWPRRRCAPRSASRSTRPPSSRTRTAPA